MRGMKRIETLGYPEYSNCGHTFTKGIQQKGSWIRSMVDEMREWGTCTKLEFMSTFRPHIVENGKVRPGWGTSGWGALQKCGLIQKTKFRRKGYVVMEPGPRYREFLELTEIFEETGEMSWETIDEVRKDIQRDDPEHTFVRFFTKDTVKYDWVFVD